MRPKTFEYILDVMAIVMAVAITLAVASGAVFFVVSMWRAL